MHEGYLAATHEIKWLDTASNFVICRKAKSAHKLQLKNVTMQQGDFSCIDQPQMGADDVIL